MTRIAGLLRVTVASGDRRADLALPGAVPVVELLPELARLVDVDAGAAPVGVHLVAADGRRLDVDIGLEPQGVDDGAVLSVVLGEHLPPRIYDDVAEAVADVVGRDVAGWSTAAARLALLWAASLLAALGAGALLAHGGSRDGAAAAAIAGVLAVGAGLLERAYAWPVAGAALLAPAACHAAVAGLVLTPSDEVSDLLASSGAAVLAVGVIGALGLSAGRVLALPPALVGAVVTVTAAVLRFVQVEPAVALTVALCLVVLTGGAVPWLAVGVVSAQAAVPFDVHAVATDARLALDVLVAASAAGGLLLVLVAPFAVSLGPAGTWLAVAASVAVGLRPRQYHARVAVLTGLVSGVTGLSTTVVTVVVLHPEWRALTAVALFGAAVTLLSVLLLPLGEARRRLLGDLTEAAALLALPPLLAVATGLVGTVG